MSSFEEIEIINNVLKGNVNEYEKLIDKYQCSLYGYVLKLVKNQYMAEDIVQETFVKGYNNLHKFNKNKEFSIWIVTIARNTAFNFIKKNKRTINIDHIESINVDSVKDRKNTPENIIEQLEGNKVVDEVIHKLPEKYSRLIKLKYFEDLTYKEISEATGITEKKVKWMLYEGRKKMLKIYKEKLGKEFGGEVYEL